MSKQYPGGLITKTPVTPSGPYETSTASGIWTLDQQAYWRKLNQWPIAGSVEPDPQFNYVTMLLHGDGTNGAQNNTFLDSSTNNYTITRYGNTTQGSFSPYGSNWSNYFDGSGDYLTCSVSVPATGAFTVEMFVFPTSTAGYQLLFSQYTSGNAGSLQLLWDDTTDKFTVNIGTGALAGTTTNVNIGSALSTTTVNVNGKLVATSISGIFVRKLGASSTIATTAESIIGNVEILGNTLSSVDALNITSRVRKTGSNGTYLLRYYLNTIPSSTTGATQIAISATQTATALMSATFERQFHIDGGNLLGSPFATASNDGIVSGSSVGSVAFNVATTYYIITTITLASALDTASLIGEKITNF